jgi:hypothetical protein
VPGPSKETFWALTAGLIKATEKHTAANTFLKLISPNAYGLGGSGNHDITRLASIVRRDLGATAQFETSDYVDSVR